MEKLTSILVVIDPADDSRHVLTKAMILARHFQARLELFLCDSENAYVLSHSYDRAVISAAREGCLIAGRRYLDAVRRSLAEDVEITTHVACESPLYEAIVHRVLEARPDLVIKSASGSHALRRFAFDANDWQLARTCPVPLMLTRGKPWSARPRFGAAVDMEDSDGRVLVRSILETAGFMAGACQGDLDVVFSSNPGVDSGTQRRQAESLNRLVEEFRVGAEHATILRGAAEDTLPGFVASQNFDVLVMGALTHRKGLAALVGTLTSRLVDTLDCDFVLVKPETYACPVSLRMAATAGCAV
jgi:universal stress protein E